jgi:hypothetical protein
MGFLQNYLGLEPAYKDGYDLPLRGTMKQRCNEIGRALTGSDLGTKARISGSRGIRVRTTVGGVVMNGDPSKIRVAAGPKSSRCVNLNLPRRPPNVYLPFDQTCGAVSVCFRPSPVRNRQTD